MQLKRNIRQFKKAMKNDLRKNGNGFVTLPFGLSTKRYEYHSLQDIAKIIKEMRKNHVVRHAFYNDKTKILRHVKTYNGLNMVSSIYMEKN